MAEKRTTPKKTTDRVKNAPAASKATAAKKAPAADKKTVRSGRVEAPAKKKAVARPVTRTAVRKTEPRAALPKEQAAPRPKIEARPLPTAPAGHAPVVGADGSPNGSLALAAVWSAPKQRAGVLFQAFQAARANARLGTAATRNRTRVKGGGAKPWKQKGTGRARQGSTRSPQWRHGAVAFGPNGRKYWHRIPERMRKAAFAEAFAARAAEGRVIVFDQIGGLSERPRSREVYDWLARIGDTGRTVIVAHQDNESHGRAMANLSDVQLRTVGSLTLADVLRAHTVLVARPALEALAFRADVDAGRSNGKAVPA